MERYRRWQGVKLVEEIESLHLLEGEQRVLLVDDVQVAVAGEQSLFRYQYGNHLGSVAAELDQDARVISFEEFHPYGTSAVRAMDSTREVPARRYRYTGMERDEESGLNCHEARYYAAWLGRWVSSDPIGLGDIANLYVYTRNNPVIHADLTGNQTDAPKNARFDRAGEMLAEARRLWKTNPELAAKLNSEALAVQSAEMKKEGAFWTKALALTSSPLVPVLGATGAPVAIPLAKGVALSMWEGTIGPLVAAAGTMIANRGSGLLGSLYASAQHLNKFASNVVIAFDPANVMAAEAAALQRAGSAVLGEFSIKQVGERLVGATVDELMGRGARNEGPMLSKALASTAQDATEKIGRGTAGGVRMAAEQGLTINPSKGVVGVSSHNTAPLVRAATGVTGATHQSTHVLPQAVHRALGTSPGKALTSNLPTAVNTALDTEWKKKWRAAQDSGIEVTLDDAVKWVTSSIENADPKIVSPELKGVYGWMLELEVRC